MLICRIAEIYCHCHSGHLTYCVVLLIVEASSNWWCDVVVIRTDAGRCDSGTCSRTISSSSRLQTLLNWCRLSSADIFQSLRAACEQWDSVIISNTYFGQFWHKCFSDFNDM